MTTESDRTNERASAPGDANALFGLAYENHKAGKLQEAEMLYRRVLEIDRQHADTWHGLGLIAVQTDHPADSITLFKNAIALEGTNPEFHNNLGMAYMDSGNASRAAKAFRAALDLAPDYLEARFNLGVAEIQRDEWSAAADAFGAVLKTNPEYPGALVNFAGTAKRARRFAEAAPAFDKLIEAEPEKVHWLKERADCALELRDKDLALELTERALAIESDDPAIIDLAARTRAHCGRPRDAIQQLIQAHQRRLERHPGDASSTSALANALSMEGRVAEARALYEDAAERDPENPNWRFNAALAALHLGDAGVVDEFRALADLKDSKVAATAFYALVDENPRELTEERLAEADAWLARDGLEPRDKTYLLFAKGRLLEAMGSNDAAFEAYALANAERRSRIPYDARGQMAFINDIRAVYGDMDSLPRSTATLAEGPQPIFIVGMPRSGTTLLERVVAGHPEVHPAGELTFFPEVVTRLGYRFANNDPFPAVGKALSPEALDELASEYRATLADRLQAAGSDARYVIDKMPYNFLHVGLLHQLFPNAKFLITARAAPAIAWSIFSNDFVGRHPYANGLDSLGVACAGQERLCEHWLDALPSHATKVAYETLVNDFEPEVARVMDFLGLNVHPDCLEFHRQKGAVRTASVWQVRQPLYQSSAEKWRRFEQHLGPFFESYERERAASAPKDGARG